MLSLQKHPDSILIRTVAHAVYFKEKQGQRAIISNISEYCSLTRNNHALSAIGEFFDFFPDLLSEEELIEDLEEYFETYLDPIDDLCAE